MVTNFLLVASGGALGAMARYGMGLILSPAVVGGIPLGVIAVNIAGSFLMGVVATYFASRGMVHLSPLVMTGFLGGFTTFSTFSLEAVKLIEKGQFATTLAYVLLSVFGSILALMIGILITRLNLA